MRKNHDVGDQDFASGGAACLRCSRIIMDKVKLAPQGFGCSESLLCLSIAM